jgi:outer membrane protein assembly factor BamA
LKDIRKDMKSPVCQIKHCDKLAKAYCRGFGLLAIFLLFAVGARAHRQEPTSWTLTKIEVTGLNRYNQELVIAESGLKVGQPIDLTGIANAAERLRNSGLFSKAAYSYRYLEDKLELTFKTEEAVWNLPVIFDNFVWFSDEEIRQAVAREVPTFDGFAPKSGGIINRIAKVLERLLQERKVAGQIEYTPSYEESGADKNHIFSVKGLNLSICAVRFPSASGIAESELLKNSKALLNTPYSKGFVMEYAKSNLLPLYKERGYLQVKFIGIQAKQEALANCKNGVAMSLLFEEGATYNLHKVEWANNSAIAVKDLDAMLMLKPGEVANGIKFDNGIKAIKAAYGKLGFIRAALTPAAAFEADSRLVSYRVNINEGNQYRMGNLNLIGLTDNDMERAKKKWKLKQGDVYDATYINEYLKTGLDAKFIARILEAKLNPDNQNLSVDVTIRFQ